MREIMHLLLGGGLPFIGGIWVMLAFSGWLKPNSKDEKENERFNAIVAKQGKTYVVIGFVLMAYGAYTIARALI